MFKGNQSLYSNSLPDSFKKSFLIEFTRELIKNSMPQLEQKIPEPKKIIEEMSRQKQIVQEQKKEIFYPVTEKPRLEIREKTFTEKPRLEIHRFKEGMFAPKPQIQRKMPLVLRIPEPPLPPTFQYLKPSPSLKEIDLQKLNPLVKDPFVRIIECNGPDEHILVQGSMGRKMTNIVLSKEEIEEVIKKFSEATKIPIQTGIYKVVAGRLILTAIISEVTSIKFTIKKMIFPQLTRRI